MRVARERARWRRREYVSGIACTDVPTRETALGVYYMGDCAASSLAASAQPLPCGFGSVLSGDALAAAGIGAWSDNEVGPSDTALLELWKAMVEAKGLLVLQNQQELQQNPAAYMNFSARLLRVASGGDPAAVPVAQPLDVDAARAAALAEQLDPDNNGSARRHGSFHGNFHVGSSNVEGWPDIRRVGNLHEHGGPECVLSRLGMQWHVDGPKTTAPHFSFLFGIECAGPGSETLFCSGLQAFAALPEHLQEVVRTGRVMKSWRYRSGGPVARDFVNGLRMSDNGLRVSQRCHTFQPTWKLSVDYEPLASMPPPPYDQSCPSFVFSPVALDRICEWDERVCGPLGDGLTADEEWCEPRCDYCERCLPKASFVWNLGQGEA